MDIKVGDIVRGKYSKAFKLVTGFEEDGKVLLCFDGSKILADKVVHTGLHLYQIEEIANFMKGTSGKSGRFNFKRYSEIKAKVQHKQETDKEAIFKREWTAACKSVNLMLGSKAPVTKGKDGYIHVPNRSLKGSALK